VDPWDSDCALYAGSPPLRGITELRLNYTQRKCGWRSRMEYRELSRYPERALCR